MDKMKALVVTLSILLFTPAYAEMYKCESKGIVSFQQKPCKNGTQTTIKAPARQSPKEAQENGIVFKEGITLGPFSIRAEPENLINSIPIAYKVGVTNATSKAQELYIKYNAIDRDGFLIDYEAVSGTVSANSYKILTGRGFIKAAEYRRIYKWELVK